MSKKQSTDEPVKILDVYNEFNKLSDKYHITTFKSRKVNKNYAFNIADVPDACDYLEVRYSVRVYRYSEFHPVAKNLLF